MFPITLTYNTVDGFSDNLQEFSIDFKYAMINSTGHQQTTARNNIRTTSIYHFTNQQTAEKNNVPITSNYLSTNSENEPTGTKPGHFVNDTQKGITSIPLSTTIEDLKTPNGLDENCNTKDNPTLIIVLATLLGSAVLLVIILTLRLFRKLAYYSQIVSTTSEILRTPKPELQNENEMRQEKEVQQRNEMQQDSEVRQENDEAQEENNPENIEDMYSVVNKKEKTSKNEKEMVDNVLYNM
ncbi:uncharacterized protein LOC120326446 [Styela clava]